MGADFAFRYFPSPEEEPAVEETVSDGFVSLFDCPAVFLDRWNLWSPFVREYREQNPSLFDDNEESSTRYEMLTYEEIPDPDNIDWDEYGWGPSSPFEPSVAREWAQSWITMIETLEEMDNKELLSAVFPYQVNINGVLYFKKEIFTTDLERLIKQADEAEKQGLKLTAEWIT